MLSASPFAKRAMHWGPPSDPELLYHSWQRDSFFYTTALILSPFTGKSWRERDVTFFRGLLTYLSLHLHFLHGSHLDVKQSWTITVPLLSPDLSPAGSRANFSLSCLSISQAFSLFLNNYFGLSHLLPSIAWCYGWLIAVFLLVCLVNTGKSFYVIDKELRFVPYTVV